MSKVALDVWIVDERGVRIEALDQDLKRSFKSPLCPCLNDFLPRFKDENFVFLRYIDPYGDTVFNRLQMPPLRAELRILIAQTSDDYGNWLLHRVDDFAAKCESTFYYLKFVGD